MNFFGVFERGFAADFGIRARAETFGELRAELQFHGRLREFQRLQVRVGGDELDAFDFGADHAVDGVASAAAHTDHFNLRAGCSSSLNDTRMPASFGVMRPSA